MGEKVSSIIIAVLCCFSVSLHSAEGDCGLRDIEDGSEYRLPPQSDSMEKDFRIWDYPLVGSGLVNYTVADTHPHAEYIRGTFTNSFYRLYAKDNTKDFTRIFKSREIIRNIRIYCKDGEMHRYFLVIPLADMTPPKFEESKYEFTIPTNWDRKRPISEGKFVIVSDNAYELQDGDDNNFRLEFQATMDNSLRFEPVPLWVEPYPGRYYYRLDIYLDDSYQALTPGTFQVGLSARDKFNSGTTIIQINVIDP